MDIVRIKSLLDQGYSRRRIAKLLGVGRNTLRKIVPDPGGSGVFPAERRRKLDAYDAEIREMLQANSRIRAMDVFLRIRSAGYAGGYDLVKKKVHALRVEQIRAEARPGLQAEVDFDRIEAGIWNCFLFSMSLTYSGKLFAELVEKRDMDSFLDCHRRAFAFFGGVPREVLYRKQGNSWVRRIAGPKAFNLPLQRFAEHFGFAPREAPPRVPWAMGRLKRPVCLVRTLFLGYLTSNRLDEANTALLGWLERREESLSLNPGLPVREKFEAEKKHLGHLPELPFARFTPRLRADGLRV